jgi:hypothetical protein
MDARVRGCEPRMDAATHRPAWRLLALTIVCALLAALPTPATAVSPEKGSLACDVARDALDAARQRLRKLRHHGASDRKIRKAKQRVEQARQAVAVECLGGPG